MDGKELPTMVLF